MNEQLFLSLGYCILMLVVAFISIKFPSKKINYMYGYRTRRSMANQEVWEVALKYSTRLMMRITLISLFFPPILYFLFPKYNLLITIIIHTVLLISTLYFTEKHLDIYFDKDGNRK